MLKRPGPGNNLEGRKGKLRCKQCRTWRQKVFEPNCESRLTCKCVYENTELPCTVCIEKRLRCTAADKIWGRKRELRQLEMKTRNMRSATIYEHKFFSDGDEIIEIVPHQFPTPDEEMLTPLEAIYIQYFYEKIVNAYLRAYVTDNFRNF